MISNKYHTPVLLTEAVDGLKIKKDGVYVDVTYGGGGHSREILSRLGEKGRLIAFDQDFDSKVNLIQNSLEKKWRNQNDSNSDKLGISKT